MARKPYKIPFSKHGEGSFALMEWSPAPEDQVRDGTSITWMFPDQWRENSVFYARLRYEGSYKGRSAVRFVFSNIDNSERYTMGLAAFDKIVERMKLGEVQGFWTFKKQGQNYGLVEGDVK